MKKLMRAIAFRGVDKAACAVLPLFPSSLLPLRQRSGLTVIAMLSSPVACIVTPSIVD